MNKIIIVICTWSLILLCFCQAAYPNMETLPIDFMELASKTYKVPSEFKLSAGGGENQDKASPLKHYPIIMIPANKRSFKDWLGQNYGNATGETNVYKKFIHSGFTPQELWLYQYTQEGKEMKNIEELTDGLKWFIYSVLWYTKSNKIQILAHGEGAVLTQAAIKKYNLYNLIHAVVYIAGPFHGSPIYTYTKAFMGSPVCANLAIDSDFLQDINLPDETPYNVFEKENKGNKAIKYTVIYNGLTYADNFFLNTPESPSLLDAHNYELNSLNHDGLRCSDESTNLFVPFLSDNAIPYNPLYDKDNDGFMSNEFGGPDCNDNDPSIFPGAAEIPQDNIDQDCNEMDICSGVGKDCLVPIKKN